MTEFVNPYNFIPFETSGAKRDGAWNDSGDLSGWIDVCLEPKRSIIIPGVKLSEKDGHKTYDFFRLSIPDGQFAIPGSTLRGMIRSVYEAASNSCLPFLLKDSDITLRTPTYAAFRNRGLLSCENGVWKLYQVKDRGYTIDDPIYNDGASNPNNEDLICPLEGHKITEAIQDGYYISGRDTATPRKYENGQRVFAVIRGYRAELCENTKKTQGWLQFNTPPGLGTEPIQIRSGDNAGRYKYPTYEIRVLVPDQRNIVEFKSGDDAEVSDIPDKGDHVEISGTPYEDIRTTLEATLDYQKGDAKTVEEYLSRMTDRTTPHISLYRRLEEVRNGNGMLPVWYQTVQHDGKRIYYFSPSAIGRVHQSRNWQAIMEDGYPVPAGQQTKDVRRGYAPCNDAEHLCAACRLFGTTGIAIKPKIFSGSAIRGHLRFTDALPQDPIAVTEDIEKPKYPANAQNDSGIIEEDQEKQKSPFKVLPILSTPKPTAFEFYLERPYGASYWNYDYYRDRNGYHFLARVRPRGRKMYWHGKECDDGTAPSSQNASVKVLPHDEHRNHRFDFRVYFDRISEKQLRELAWAITLRDNGESEAHWHKIGHARPLGFGSVELTIQKIMVRTIKKGEDGGLGYQLEPKKLDVGNCPWEKDTVKPERIRAILAMTNSQKTENVNVEYPRVAGDEHVYEWFAQNRKKAQTLKTLPKPTGASITLSDQWETNDNHGGHGGSQRRQNDGNGIAHNGNQSNQYRQSGVNRQGNREQQSNNGPQQSNVRQNAGTGNDLIGKEMEGVITGFHKNGSAYVRLPGEKNGFLQQRGERLDLRFKEGQSMKVRVYRYDAAYDQYQVRLVEDRNGFGGMRS